MPQYYAEGTYLLRFDLQGDGFDTLPSDAIAVAMRDNENPLEFVNYPYTPEGERRAIMRIEKRSANALTMAAEEEAEHSVLTIGAIVSADRQTVYWVNDTKPIP